MMIIYDCIWLTDIVTSWHDVKTTPKLWIKSYVTHHIDGGRLFMNVEQYLIFI